MKEDRLSREFSLKGHEDGVDQLSWHPSDPNILASASADKTLRLWDIRTQVLSYSFIFLKHLCSLYCFGNAFNFLNYLFGSKTLFLRKVLVLSLRKERLST